MVNDRGPDDPMFWDYIGLGYEQNKVKPISQFSLGEKLRYNLFGASAEREELEAARAEASDLVKQIAPTLFKQKLDAAFSNKDAPPTLDPRVLYDYSEEEGPQPPNAQGPGEPFIKATLAPREEAARRLPQIPMTNLGETASFLNSLYGAPGGENKRITAAEHNAMFPRMPLPPNVSEISPAQQGHYLTQGRWEETEEGKEQGRSLHAAELDKKLEARTQLATMLHEQRKEIVGMQQQGAAARQDDQQESRVQLIDRILANREKLLNLRMQHDDLDREDRQVHQDLMAALKGNDRKKVEAIVGTPQYQKYLTGLKVKNVQDKQQSDNLKLNREARMSISSAVSFAANMAGATPMIQQQADGSIKLNLQAIKGGGGKHLKYFAQILKTYGETADSILPEARRSIAKMAAGYAKLAEDLDAKEPVKTPATPATPAPAPGSDNMDKLLKKYGG